VVYPLHHKAGIVWLVQALSGLVLAVLLFLHLTANHFIVKGGLQTYQDVVSYLSNPLIFVLEVIFLIAVTIHALLGVRAIILEIGLTRRFIPVIDRVLQGLGFMIIGYGFWLTFTVVNH